MTDPRFEDFAEWMRRPSFGSRTKREVELKVFELLYRDRIASGTVTVGDVAEELAVTRARARSLLLETRTRLAAEIRAGLREQRDLERAFRKLEQERATKTERFVRYARFAVQYALPVVDGVRGLVG